MRSTAIVVERANSFPPSSHGASKRVGLGRTCQPHDEQRFHQGKVLLSKVSLSASDELLDIAAETSSSIPLGSYPAQAFDVVLWNGALHLAADKPGALEQTRRVLRRGGRVGIAATAREREHGFDRALRTVLKRLGVSNAVRLPRAGSQSVSTEEVLAWLWEAGFVDISLQIRTFGDTFADSGEIMDRYFSTFAETMFARRGGSLRERVKRELRAELDLQRTAQGIRLERHVIFAVATVGSP